MTIKYLEKKAEMISKLIGEPVEIEVDNPGGYEFVIWIGKGNPEDRLCLTFFGVDAGTDDPPTAADDCWNSLILIQEVCEYLKKNGKMK